MATLPDYLTDQTEEAIRQRMLDSLPSDLDKAEGSFIWDSLDPVAIELALAAIWAQQALRRGFASTAFGDYLDLRCEEHGVTRKAAVNATGQVKFTGTPDTTTVPVGARVATPADPATNTQSVEFVTTKKVTLDGSGVGYADIEAVVAGTSGNVPVGSISILSSPLAGITGVTNLAATTGGADTESDTDLLDRYLLKVQNPGTSGNKADYMKWALEVDGVGAAQVIPVWSGPGTVKVILLGTDKLSASSEVVAAVQNYISPSPETGEGKAPVGATVTVVTATVVNINISATVTLDGTKTLQEVQVAFETSLADYLAEIAFSADPTVRYSRTGSILLDTAGVQDYSDLLVNGGTGNVTISSGQVAVTGTVTLT